MSAIRNSKGWLTKRALGQGYVEQSIRMVGEARRIIELYFDDETGKYKLYVALDGAEDQVTFFEANQLALARAQFTKEVRH